MTEKNGCYTIDGSLTALMRACGYQPTERWYPHEHTLMYGEPVAFPAACRCDRRLTEPHNEPSCPYASPELWYAAEVERMKERAPA